MTNIKVIDNFLVFKLVNQLDRINIISEIILHSTKVIDM